jgi:hypothetical protein
MSKYIVELSPVLKNIASEGGLDSAILNGNSIQRTLNMIDYNGKKISNAKDGDIISSDNGGEYFSEIIKIDFLVCPDGTSGCLGNCVDLDNDSNNCGGCFNVCGEGYHCQNGVCVETTTTTSTTTSTTTTSSPGASSGTLIFNGQNPTSGGSYVSAPGSTVGTWLPGTGDFTVEWFQYQTATGHPRVFSVGPDTNATIGVSIEANKVYKWLGGKNWNIGVTYLNTWVHIALVRASGMMSVYINGTMSGTAQTDTTNVTGSSKDLYIGSDGITNGDGFAGKITNFRWTNSAVYTENFSPITSPLTVLADTKLLMLGGTVSNPAVDSTGINTLTNFNTTWSSDTPFV